MRDMLEGAERRALRDIEQWERDDYDAELLTAGVGFYYFEDT